MRKNWQILRKIKKTVELCGVHGVCFFQVWASLRALGKFKFAKQNINFKKVPAISAILEFGSAAEGMIVFVLRSVRVRGCGRGVCCEKLLSKGLPLDQAVC